MAALCHGAHLQSCAKKKKKVYIMPPHLVLLVWCRTKTFPHVEHNLHLIPIRALLLVTTSDKLCDVRTARASASQGQIRSWRFVSHCVSSWHVSVRLCFMVIRHSRCVAQSMHMLSLMDNGCTWFRLFPMTPTSTTSTTCGTQCRSCFVMNRLTHSWWFLEDVVLVRIARTIANLVINGQESVF